MKYIKISIVILLVSFISIFAYKLTTNNSTNKLSLTKEQMKKMLSYTIDGNSTSSMPTKGSGYKVKSITCKNGSILSWDNDNWLLEVEKLESEDLCNIDFTTGTGSYTVTAVPSIAGSLDSTSKTTTENGQVTFYTKLVIDSVSGCTNEIGDGKVIIKNVTSNTTCNINVVSFIKLYDRLLADNPTRSTRDTYDAAFTSNTPKTLYKATENGMGVYYFAGLAATRSGVGACQITSEDYGYTFSTENGSDNKIVYANTVAEAETLLESWTGIVLTENECKTENICLITGEYWTAVLGVSEEDCLENGIEYNPVANREWELKDYIFNKDSISIINNWVKFGKNSSNQDLYWRIIRTNADGSIRLLYHGTSTTATDAYIGTSKFNEKYNDSMYVGYMYGTSGSQENNRTNTNDSTIKTYIDNWYASNMTSYTKYLSTTAVYCNDRELASGASYSTTGSFYYAAYTRLKTNKTPTYDCTNDNDKFTVDASTGNGKLTYPIALMTADEIAYAGGVAYTDAPMWYYTNSSLESSTGATEWWSLSPFGWNGNYAYSWLVVGLGRPGDLGDSNVNSTNGVRPAISLKSCIKYSTGNGSASAPYTIKETTSGC